MTDDAKSTSAASRERDEPAARAKPVAHSRDACESGRLLPYGF